MKARWIEQAEKVLKGEILRHQYEVANGDSRTIYENLVAPAFFGGTITGIVGISTDISERKRVEEKLLVSEKHYRTLAELAHDMIFIVNDDGYFEYVNSFAAAQFGLKPEDLIGKLRDELFAPAVREKQRRNLQKVFESKSPTYLEDKVSFPAGEKWLGTWLVPIDNPAGEVRSVIGLSRDISERKKAEEILEESEKRFRSLLETTSDWVWEVDRNGFYTYASPKVRDLLGYEPEEVIGKRPFDLMPAEEGERLEKWFEGIVKSCHAFTGLENTNLNKHGQSIVLETSGVPIFQVDGSFAGYRGIDRDITERKKMESALRQNQLRDEARRAELERLLEAIPTPVCICHDPECRCITGNRAAHEMLGVPEKDQNLSASAPEEEKPDYYVRVNGVPVLPEELPMQRAVSTGKVVRGYEMEIVQPDGSVRFIYGNAVPLRDENGEVRGCLGAFMDITERKQMEEELRKSHDELEIRVQERTHELEAINEELRIENEERLEVEIDLRESENHLRQLSAELLNAQEKERRLVAQEIHDSIGASLAAAKFKMESIFKHVGENRPQTQTPLESIIPMIQRTIDEARRIQMALRPSILDDFGILATLDWACREFESIYSNIRISKETHIQEDEVPDSLKTVIYRVSQEALNNIAKHSKANRVFLSLRKTDQGIKLVIEDNGEGFDPAGTHSHAGTGGLGLDSMRERVELSEGSYSIESKKGFGTVIRASWPFQSEKQG